MSLAASVSNSANLESLRPLRELYFELGRALLSHNRYTDAVQAFEQALKAPAPLVTWCFSIWLWLASRAASPIVLSGVIWKPSQWRRSAWQRFSRTSTNS